MSSEADLPSLIAPLVSLASTAGHSISALYTHGTEVSTKEDGSPVTLADQHSHVILKHGLEKIMPSFPVISEEDPSSWNLESDSYWLIDPLDGTSGFIHKTGEFCINIAFMQHNYPVLGLIHLPLTQETFYGYKGMAWHHFSGLSTPIHTRPTPPDGRTLLLGCYGKGRTVPEDTFLMKYSIKTTQIMRSAIKFCYIAAGKADIYLRKERCGEWDTAAGQALVEAAGGSLIHLDGSALLYGKPGLKMTAFVVFGDKNDLPLYS